MNNLLRNTSYLILAASVVFITACSSSGSDSSTSEAVTYAGNLDPATIDDLNALEIAIAAGESVQVADSSTGLPTAITSSNNGAGIDLLELNEIVISTVNTLRLPAGVDVSESVCSSGTADVSDSGNTSGSGPIDMTITYGSCVLIGADITDITVNGTVSIHVDDIADFNAGFAATYTNFTVTDSLGTTTINMTMVCGSSSGNFSCTFNSDFVGSDGITHRVSDFSITGSAGTGFNGSAVFYHGTHGGIRIDINMVTYGDCGSIPDGGTITFESTDGTSSGTVTFNTDGSCGISGTWSNSTGSGSF